MSTLLLRLAAPLQSWGSDSKFEIRSTEREPTKSGVIGLLSSALGIGREDDISFLNDLRFGIRTDREGRLLKDFQIARHPNDVKKTYLTTRYYLSDAVFLAGLESDDTELLKKLDHALRHPVYPLFLGRRSCPVTLPLVLGIRECDLITALESEPLLCENSGKVRIRYDDSEADPRSRIQDVPISFSVRHRQFGYRKVSEKITAVSVHEEHDPMAEL